MQAYYKLSYVDRRVENPEQRICEDIPKFCCGLAELSREWINAIVDSVFYAWELQNYSRTNIYTFGIIGYVLGAGTLTTVLAPNFGRLFKKREELQGKKFGDCTTKKLCLK